MIGRLSITSAVYWWWWRCWRTDFPTLMPVAVCGRCWLCMVSYAPLGHLATVILMLLVIFVTVFFVILVIILIIILLLLVIFIFLFMILGFLSAALLFLPFLEHLQLPFLLLSQEPLTHFLFDFFCTFRTERIRSHNDAMFFERFRYDRRFLVFIPDVSDVSAPIVMFGNERWFRWR